MICELEHFEPRPPTAKLPLQLRDGGDYYEAQAPFRPAGELAAECRLQRAAKGEFILIAIEVVDVDAEAIAGGVVAHNANRVCSAWMDVARTLADPPFVSDSMKLRWSIALML